MQSSKNKLHDQFSLSVLSSITTQNVHKTGVFSCVLWKVWELQRRWNIYEAGCELPSFPQLKSTSSLVSPSSLLVVQTETVHGG